MRAGGEISVVYNGQSAAAGMDAALCSAEPESGATRADGVISCRAHIDLEAISAWQNPTCRGVAWRGAACTRLLHDPLRILACTPPLEKCRRT